MKKSIFTFFSAFMLFVFVNQAFAQVPQGFNYQAVARNAAGTLLQNQGLGVKLDIHQGTATGTVVYSERQTPSTNAFGLFTVTVGQGTSLSGTFNTILWSSGSYWLEVSLDVSGGTTYTAMGTSQLLSVPYAMYAGSSASSSLPSGTSGQTLRHDGSNWVANSLLYNNGTNLGINTLTPTGKLDVNYDANIYTQIGLPSGALKAANGANNYTYLAWGSYAAIFNGNVVPNSTNTYDLGSNTFGFHDLYMTNKLFINSAATPNSILGTTGTGTLQWVDNAIGFSAYSSVAQSLSTSTQVAFDTEEYDDGNNFATNAFTAPVAGVYHFDAHTRFTANTTTGVYCWLAFYVNGANRKTATGLTSADVFGLQISADLKLAAGDVVKVYYNGPALTTSSPIIMNTWFTGHKVY